MKFSDLHAAFGVPNNVESLLQAYIDLSAEYHVMVDEIEQVKDKPTKYELYKKNLPDILSTIDSFGLTISSKTAMFTVNQMGLVALRFIAADLAQDEPAQEDELTSLRRLVTELQQEIEQSTTIKGKTKEWLLDLVRIIRDSLDRYNIRGSRGMRKQFALLLGELMLNYDLAKEASTEEPSIWNKITSAIDIMNKVASLAEKARPVIGLGVKLLGYVKQLNLPLP